MFFSTRGRTFDYELNEIFFKDLEIRKPDYFWELAGGRYRGDIGQIITSVIPILVKEARGDTDFGDTNSCLLPSCEAPKDSDFPYGSGQSLLDQRVPEEINRKIVDHISDINLPYTSIAREYLLPEGLPPDRIIKIGSPMYEVLHYYMEKIEISDILLDCH